MGKILRKISAISIGWYYWITNRNNKIARERLAICSGCDKRKVFQCGICGCVLQPMARLIGQFDEGCSDTPKRWLPIKSTDQNEDTRPLTK